MADDPTTDQGGRGSCKDECPSTEECEDGQELHVRYLEQQRRMNCRACGDGEETF